MTIRLLLVDDHSVVRQGLRMFLSLDAELSIVGEAVNGAEAIQKAHDLQPDVILIGTGSEVWLPPNDLREALRRVHVGIDALQTGPAIRTYNIMMGERRRVAAALIAVP